MMIIDDMRFFVEHGKTCLGYPPCLPIFDGERLAGWLFFPLFVTMNLDDDPKASGAAPSGDFLVPMQPESSLMGLGAVGFCVTERTWMDVVEGQFQPKLGILAKNLEVSM